MKTIVALYDRRRDAKRAVRELVNRGISHDRISLVSPAHESESRSTQLRLDDDSEHIDEAAADARPTDTVASSVGIGGMILGAVFLSLPAIGPVLAAGPLLAGIAASGAQASGEDLAPSLGRSGVPQRDADRYTDAVRRGHALVVVVSDDDHVEDVASTLAKHSPIAA